MGSNETEDWSANGMELSWWPAKGLIEMRFVEAQMRATGDDAKALTEQLERWTKSRTEGFGILVDCEQIVKSDPAWRAVLSAYFRTRKFPLWIAWFNASILVRVSVEMFTLATPRLHGRVFADEAAARAFLREGGFG